MSKERAAKVIGLIKEVRLQMPRIGTRKLYYLLENRLQEIGVGRDKMFAILKANHLLVKPHRAYHKTTDSYHRFRKHKNLIACMTVSRPEQVWVADITYLGNRLNPMYLALITDTYSKKIVGYNLSKSLANQGALSALQMAIKSRRYKGKELIHHSDRGFQYCSDDYQNHLTKASIRCSMTESYDPYANAVAERVNGIIKYEFLNLIKVDDQQIMKKVVEQVVKVYNTKRPHLSCNMLTPEQMHEQDKVIIKTYKSKNLSKAILTEV